MSISKAKVEELLSKYNYRKLNYFKFGAMNMQYNYIKVS